MDGVLLPAELERFVAEAVAAGDYSDPAAVVTAGVRLLRDLQTTRAMFLRSLDEAHEEAERDGWLGLEEVMAQADAVIAGLPKAG